MDAPRSPAAPAAARESDRERNLARVRERIVAFAASRMSKDNAEDLAQEVMLVVHTKYADVQALEDLLPLCLRILRFKMVAALRKAHRRGEDAPVAAESLSGDGPSPEAIAARHEIAERLAKAVRKIGPRCKELLKLKLEGRTFPEIQAILGVKSINTIYTWDFRCRKHLLELMGGSWEGRK